MRPTKAAVAAELRKKTGRGDVEAMIAAQVRDTGGGGV
jgi:hypothetical protein